MRGAGKARGGNKVCWGFLFWGILWKTTGLYKDIFRFYFGLTIAGRQCELVASPVVSFSWHLFSIDRGGKTVCSRLI